MDTWFELIVSLIFAGAVARVISFVLWRRLVLRIVEKQSLIPEWRTSAEIYLGRPWVWLWQPIAPPAVADAREQIGRNFRFALKPFSDPELERKRRTLRAWYAGSMAAYLSGVFLFLVPIAVAVILALR